MSNGLIYDLMYSGKYIKLSENIIEAKVITFMTNVSSNCEAPQIIQAIAVNGEVVKIL